MPHEKILKAALKNGGEYADLFYESSTSTRVVCEDKKVETASTGVDAGAGLRVIANLKTVYGHTNDLGELLKLGETLSEAVSAKKFDQNIKVAPSTSPVRFPIARPPGEVPLAEKVRLVCQAEKLAWSLNPAIVQVRIAYSDVLRHVEIASSDGAYAKAPKTLTVLSATITASDGKEFYRGYESMGGHLGYELFTEQDWEQTVRTAVGRALLNMRAERARGGTMPVVISSQAGGTMVHEAVGHGLEADLATQGLSVYEGKIGQKIASDLITVVDDPTLPQRRGSYSFDDEGVPACRALLVEKGILKNFMFDRLTAMKTGNQSNAHGRRESYAHRPIVRMANTLILPGKDDPEEIIRSVDSGLFVKMMGGGEVNTVNGDFVFEVSEGYRIEHGKIGEPVRGATLTGNGLDVMKSIDKVGSDLGYSIGTCGKDGQHAPVADGMPTIRIPQMVVGGLV
ncbi:MAG: TldD/PmbA family protein [Deltaproteobacteria bacterium]|nr:TldD/PmbA family protein [Deltaproteobacteria bacterium]